MRRALCIIALLLLFMNTGHRPAGANAGPTYWEGHPAAEVLAIDRNCPVEVLWEKLLLDFSQPRQNSMNLRGQVQATYLMRNPTGNPLTVQMAFPVVSTVAGFSPAEVSVTVDAEPVSCAFYLAGPADGNLVFGKPDGDSVAFENILATLAEQPYRPQYFSPDQKGTLYNFRVDPTGEQPIRFAVAFTLAAGQTRIIGNGFNQWGLEEDRATMAAWCNRPETLEIFVSGEQPDFMVRGYTDGEQAEETDRFSYTVTTEEMALKSYLLTMGSEALPPWAPQLDEQLYNLYAEALDRQFAAGFPLVVLSEVLSEVHREQVFLLVYTVDFPAQGERTVVVSYAGAASMDRRKTRQPVYTFQYLLNPARHWQRFGNLHIEVITPERAPYLIDSTVPLQRAKDRRYTAQLEGLPAGDLVLTMYHRERISTLEPVYRWLASALYLVYFTVPFLVTAVLIAVVVVLVTGSLAKRQ